jgi:hypothetical protein
MRRRWYLRRQTVWCLRLGCTCWKRRADGAADRVFIVSGTLEADCTSVVERAAVAPPALAVNHEPE